MREHFDSILLNIGMDSQICFAVQGYPPVSLHSRIDGYEVTLRPMTTHARQGIRLVLSPYVAL